MTTLHISMEKRTAELVSVLQSELRKEVKALLEEAFEKAMPGLIEGYVARILVRGEQMLRPPMYGQKPDVEIRIHFSIGDPA